MVAAKVVLCLALAYPVSSADLSSENLAIVTRMQDILMGMPVSQTGAFGVDWTDSEHFFAPKIKCMFPSGPNPFDKTGVTYDECVGAEMASSLSGVKYNIFNMHTVKTACDGDTCFGMWNFDWCALDAKSGGCVEGTTVPGANIAVYKLNEDHVITMLDDWWKNDMWTEVDKKLASITSQTLQLSASASANGMLLLTLTIGLVLGALLGYSIGKRQSSAGSLEPYVKLDA